ncbi:hypothetical protein BT96DRAFT_1008629 [Gymnopus androsaceus JB14]|uniref:Uncharacterized protein n=1 Tax=Gymnopus androsaceus JB14 TaxID=1447944 RepID=A0A6A4GER0_9AGAR|nr:hypothetical protein BT96DRAFT_1008629 [Gymnopus androsaceus JB14]
MEDLNLLRTELDVFKKQVEELNGTCTDEWIPSSNDRARLLHELEMMGNVYDQLMKKLNIAYKNFRAKKHNLKGVLNGTALEPIVID